MSKLPPPPTEVLVDQDILKLAPLFGEKVMALITDLNRMGYDAMLFEGFRSDERAKYLYGFGREYDDGRGIVTNAPNGAKTWHRYGLAADIISKSKGWDAPATFWTALSNTALATDLTPGGLWKFADKPHVQHHDMPVTPKDEDWALLQSQGKEAVWKKYNATWDPMAA
jgi:hypothetical protein